MLFNCVFLSLYFVSLIFFCFVSHPVGYCVLLIGGSLCACFICYSLYGFSWYLALFIIVYIGGVYVLFIFVSLWTPNSFSVVGSGFVLFISFFLAFFFVFFFISDTYYFVWESSHYLCSFMEGFGYLILCFSLLGGLLGVSIVSSCKDSFFR